MRRPASLGAIVAALGLVLGGMACAPRATGPKAIVIWEQMDPEERARFVENLANYQAAHPGVEIQHVPYETEQLRTQFQTAAAAGGGPQLIFGPSDQVGPFSLLKLIKPLDTTLEPGFFDRFIPASLDTLDGHIWAAPDQVGNHLTLCYNKALVPRPPQTSAEFLAIAKKLTTPPSGGSMGRYGFAMNFTEPYWLMPFFAGFGGWVMDADRNPTLDTPAMVQALTFLHDLKDKYRVVPRECDYQVAETLFKEGKAAMVVNGPWSWSGYRAAGIDLGVAPIFKLPNGQWAKEMTASKGYSINVNVTKAELPQVIDLLTFLTSQQAQMRSVRSLGILPSSRAAYQDTTLLNDPILSASIEAFDKGRRMPVVPEMRVIWDAMRPGLQNVMNGAATPEEAARNMQAAAEKQIADMHK